MKQNTSKLSILWIIPIIAIYIGHPEYIILAGFSIWAFITYLFKIKNYNNTKIYFTTNALVLIFFLILTFIQLSSPLYTGNLLISYILAAFFILTIIIAAYDFTHDYKISEIFQLRNLSQLTKDIIAIILLIAGLLVGLLLGTYYFKI